MKQLRRMTLVCVVVATMVSFAAFTGSASARGAPGIPKLTKLWTERLVGPGTSPVVAGGIVFVTAGPSKGYPVHVTKSAVYALDAVCPPSPARCTKDLLWVHEYRAAKSAPTAELSPAGVGSGHVYVGDIDTFGGGGVVTGTEQAFTGTTGATVFSAGQAGITAATQPDGLVYATWRTAVQQYELLGTEALDASTGAPAFTTTIGSPPDPGYPYTPGTDPTTGPAVAGGSLFVGYGSSLEAFDATGVTDCAPLSPPLSYYVSFPKQCSPLWSGATGGALTGTPVVAGGEVYVGASNGVLYAFPAAGCGGPTCSPDWTANVGGSITAPVSASATTVYVGSSNGMLDAFPVGGCGFSTCSARWGAVVGGSVSGPAVSGSFVYVGSTNDELDVFHAAGCESSTCTASWQTNVRKPIDTAPAVANGVIFVSDAHRALHAYRVP